MKGLKLVPPARSAERTVLHNAILSAAPLCAEVEKARIAAERSRGALARAVDAVPAAERALAEARERAVADPDADRAELRALRAAEQDARDDLSVAREVAQRAEAVLIEAERSARYAAERIENAADLVLRGAFEPALAAAEAVGLKFAEMAFAARRIADAANPFDGERDRLVGAVSALNAHFAFRGDGMAARSAQEAAAAPWNAARAELLTNPDALLPETA